jgi:hypothetical protein
MDRNGRENKKNRCQPLLLSPIILPLYNRKKRLNWQSIIRHHLFSHYSSLYPFRSTEGLPPFICNSNIVEYSRLLDVQNAPLINQSYKFQISRTYPLTYIQSRPLDGIIHKPKKEFWHAAAMIYSVKNNCSGITKFPAIRGRSDIYGDGFTLCCYAEENFFCVQERWMTGT